MAWSWVGLLLGFVLPLFVYIASYFTARHLEYRYKERVPQALAGMAALLSSVTVLLLIFSSPYWNEGARIVWTSMQAHGEPLVIGGNQDETAIAWPNQATAPRLKVMPQANPSNPAIAALEIKGGGAFIFDEKQKRFLNGRPVPVGTTMKLGDYQIRVNSLGGWKVWQQEVEVLDGNGTKLAGFNLRPDHTRPLGYLLAGGMVTSLTRLENISQRDKLEEWAGGLWLIRNDNEKIYVLTSDDSANSECSLPAEISVHWANLTLPVDLEADERNTTLNFKSPWRLSSPMPVPGIDGCPAPKKERAEDVNLVVTSHPNPCDTAMLLPFGKLAGNVHQALTLDARTHKFNTPDAVDNEVPPICPPGVKCGKQRAGTSEVSVQGNSSYSFNLTTVNDLPSRKGILGLIALAFILFMVGLFLIYPRLPQTNRWIVYGIVTSVWLFLLLRLLLASRYVLDPAALDRLSINGIKRAFFALMIVPGLLMLWTRLRCDRSECPPEPELRRRARRFALYYLLGLMVCGLCGLYFPSRLWSGLPPNYHVSIGDIFSWAGLVFLLVSALVALCTALHIWFLYKPDKERILSGIFVEPWYWAESYATRAGNFWPRHLNRTRRSMMVFVAAVGVGFLIFLIGFRLARPALPGDKTAQEMSVPIIFYWMVILWLGLKLYLRGAGELSRRQFFYLILTAFMLVTLAAILVPFAITDFGSILPVLAIMLPLIGVLLAGRSFITSLIFLASGVLLLIAGMLLPALVTMGLVGVGLFLGVWKAKPSLKAGLAVAFGVILLFIMGGFVYQNLEGMILPNAKYLPYLGKQGRVFARLLNYKKGIQAQQNALLATTGVGAEGLPYQELLNGNQHTWENKAIAHEGGWFGEGFGEAPAHRSQVRRDTLQYDSVFSFFIMSEYGLVGGALLLLMYACPLFIIFLGGRERLDTGYAIALVVAGAFLIESLYHAGMNLGAFPMTGRNLPLLSVNSPSDLLRWTLLWGFALQAIFWRYGSGGQIKQDAVSLMDDDAGSSAFAPAEDERRAVGRRGRVRPLEPVWAYAVAIWILPFLIALPVLINGWGILHETAEFEKFNYETVLNMVKWYLHRGVITFDEKHKRLDLKTTMLTDPDEQDFIQQEVERFNARTEREKFEEIQEKREGKFEADLLTVNSERDYQKVLRGISTWQHAEPRRTIFRLVPIHDENGRIESYKVTANPDFNVSYNFKVGHTPADLPKVMYGGSILMGPAWVSGRYETAISPNVPLPWVSYLRNALESEWIRLKPQDPTRAAKLYGTLTLNKQLHEAAMNFMAAKGIELHESMLKLRAGTTDYKDKLPRRVALAVVSLPKGETVALAGWPRMTSQENSWEQMRVGDGPAQRDFWVPSARWLEREAPQSINARYHGDRNFDRSIVMGSSTKPLWAAAVLKVHPRLFDKLQVTAASGKENDVFGLELGDGRDKGAGWDLNGHGADWIGFRAYLRQSDNRYQVRLGFLGLALEDGSNNIKAAGNSASRNESLTGDKRPWQKYPQFIPGIRILPNKNQLLSLGANPNEPNTALANSQLANALHDMFSIGVKSVTLPLPEGEKREFSFRRSFWTGNENDDLSGPGSKVTALFNQIAPEAPDFAFDDLYEPRNYVTMLLGSGTNLWANVDFAAAFGSCLTGKPVIAHIVRGDSRVQPLDARKALSPDIALQLHAGLKDVVDDANGTANAALSASRNLDKFKGYSFYAKTGTLKVSEDEPATSRIVLAIVKWNNERKGEVASGLVFSVVAEQGGMGRAAVWLNDFLSANKDTIAGILEAQQ